MWSSSLEFIIIKEWPARRGALNTTDRCDERRPWISPCQSRRKEKVEVFWERYLLENIRLKALFVLCTLWLNYSFNDLGPIYGFPLTTTSYSPAIPSSATSSGCLFLWSHVNELPPVTPDWLATTVRRIFLLEFFLWKAACVFRSRLRNCDDKGELDEEAT